MSTDFILAATGKPFDDPDAAHIKRRTLNRELGDTSYVVVPHPDGGYAVTYDGVPDGDATVPVSGVPCGHAPDGPGERPAHAAQARAHSVVPGADAASPAPAPEPSAPAKGPPEAPETGPYPAAFSLGVAPRAFVHLYALIVLGVFMVLTPWGSLFAPGVIDGILTDAAWLLRLGGLCLALWSLGRFMISYLFYRYEVTKTYVLARYGIFTRETPKITFAHVRSTRVEQALWERILGVGTVRVGTGATDGHEVTLYHVADPPRLEKELQRCYQPLVSRPHQGAH